MKLTIKGIQFTQSEDTVTFDLKREEVEEMLLDMGLANLTEIIKKETGGFIHLIEPLIKMKIKVPDGIDAIDYLLTTAIDHGLSSWEEKMELKIERSGEIHVENEPK